MEDESSEVLRRLRFWLQASTDGFAWVEYLSEAQREEAVRVLSAERAVRELRVQQEDTVGAMRAFLRSVKSDAQQAVVCFHGFDPNPSSRLLLSLNLARESLAEARVHQIWWVSPGFLGPFVRGAPDLESWFQLRIPLARDPSRYLAWLHEQTAWIEVPGLHDGAGRARRFPISDLYIPLQAEGSELPLEIALGSPRLVIVGGPGSGKTTFLRKVVNDRLRDGIQFPLFLRIDELGDDIGSPDWLPTHLTQRSADLGWGLDRSFFDRKLQELWTIVFLDGLDDAPSTIGREQAARALEEAARAYPNCSFVVTARPQAFVDSVTLAGFDRFGIADLAQESVEMFLLHWSRALYPDDAERAERLRLNLLESLRRPELERMSRNPLLLTVLALVYSTGRSLPESSEELYEQSLILLASSRATRPSRESALQRLTLLGYLAEAMQGWTEDRRIRDVPSIHRGRAAEIIAPHLYQVPEQQRFAHALRFLEREEADGGIIVRQGDTIQFVHRSFQEYLAERARSKTSLG